MRFAVVSELDMQGPLKTPHALLEPPARRSLAVQRDGRRRRSGMYDDLAEARRHLARPTARTHRHARATAGATADDRRFGVVAFLVGERNAVVLVQREPGFAGRRENMQAYGGIKRMRGAGAVTPFGDDRPHANEQRKRLGRRGVTDRLPALVDLSRVIVDPVCADRQIDGCLRHPVRTLRRNGTDEQRWPQHERVRDVQRADVVDLVAQDVTDILKDCGFGPFASRRDLTDENGTVTGSEETGVRIKAVVVSHFEGTRKFIDKTLADVEVQAGAKPYWFRVDENGSFVGGIAKFAAPLQDELTKALGLVPGDFVGIAAGRITQAQKTAGVLIKTMGAAVPGHMDREQYAFCWIVDFPMYEIGEESGELEFCHNPFSMPSGGLDTLLKAERGEIDPLSITADQYDLVVNGVELSSGAVRNHDPEIMVKAFELVRLGEEDVKKKFPAMYNAFCYGAPPHAGIAPGIDRMVMLLAGEDSIREIIPFPMNKNAQDVMMGAPSEVTAHQLEELHIRSTATQEEIHADEADK